MLGPQQMSVCHLKKATIVQTLAPVIGPLYLARFVQAFGTI